MLPLARRVASRLYCPSISKLLVVWIVLHHQYGLHSESHSRPHLFLQRLTAPLVVDQRWHVQMMSDTVSPELLVHMISMSIRVLLDSLSYLGEAHPRFTFAYAHKHGLPGYARQFGYLGVEFRSILVIEQDHD